MKSKSSTAAVYRGSYGKFLETLREKTGASPEAEAIPRLLRAIADEGGKLGMKALIGRSSLSPLQLVRAVELMRSQELVTIESGAQDDVVQLTPVGQNVARLEAAR